MTNEMKLLRAFIEASGFDIEEVSTPIHLHKVSRNGSCVSTMISTHSIDYKVTKKPKFIGSYMGNTYYDEGDR